MSVTPLVLGIYALFCVGAFLLGLRFFRMAKAPSEGVSLDEARRFGRLLMMTSTALMIIPVAAWLHGDLRLGRS